MVTRTPKKRTGMATKKRALTTLLRPRRSHRSQRWRRHRWVASGDAFKHGGLTSCAQMDVHVSVFPSLAADTHVDYVSLPTSLQIDAHEFM